MSTTAKILCPRCGIEMNHHAEKPDLSDENETIEIHTCAQCGEIAARRATVRLDETQR